MPPAHPNQPKVISTHYTLARSTVGHLCRLRIVWLSMQRPTKCNLSIHADTTRRTVRWRFCSCIFKLFMASNIRNIACTTLLYTADRLWSISACEKPLSCIILELWAFLQNVTLYNIILIHTPHLFQDCALSAVCRSCNRKCTVKYLYEL
jgi:hypothetical protein